MKLRNVLLTATLVGAPAVAMAQPVDGLYVGAGAGYNYLQKLKIRSITPQVAGFPGAGGKLEGDGGFVGSLSVGYGLGNGLRIEAQGDYRQDHQKLRNSGAYQGGDSQTLSYGGFINALFDFDIGQDFVYPYVGAGAGWHETELQGFREYLPGTGLGYSGNNNSQGGFAAQGIVGLAFPFAAVPGLSVTTEYRFTGTFQSIKLSGSENLTVPTEGARIKIGQQYNHSFLVGLRYAFNTPAPPPPPAPIAAPAPAPARTYLVFFDWDRADLTARARQIISEAATNSTALKVTRLEVNGYTDLSGTAAYNQKLSVRRAMAVEAELIRDGVPKQDIAIQGFGETHPLVPTAAGVREPQNRRVEIILK